MVYRVTRSFEMVKISQTPQVGLPHTTLELELTIANRNVMSFGTSTWPLPTNISMRPRSSGRLYVTNSRYVIRKALPSLLLIYVADLSSGVWFWLLVGLGSAEGSATCGRRTDFHTIVGLVHISTTLWVLWRLSSLHLVDTSGIYSSKGDPIHLVLARVLYFLALNIIPVRRLGT